MTVARFAVLLLIASTPLLWGCEDECAPSDFGGGRQCGDEPGLYQSCDFNDCWEGPFCVQRWVISDVYCPSSAHECVQVAPGEIACVGEIIGACSTPGFVRCEDSLTMVSCREDGFGTLTLQRGPCAVGARCYDEAEDSPEAYPGCHPDF